ncbi:hypothetical protein ABTI69_22020, partial [Acinetobacter baumannii]
NRLHAAAPLDARDGSARPSRAPAHQLPYGQLRHRELTGGPQPGLCRHLAQAVGSPVGAIATLRAAATPHWAPLPKGRQKTR